MDDILKFLVVVGAIAFGIYRQFKKDNANKSKTERPVNLPDYENEPEFEPEPPIIPKESKKEKKKATTAYQPLSIPSSNQGIGNTQFPISPPTGIESEENENEFAINSQDEARRAIIWSEILQRKY